MMRDKIPASIQRKRISAFLTVNTTDMIPICTSEARIDNYMIAEQHNTCLRELACNWENRLSIDPTCSCIPQPNAESRPELLQVHAGVFLEPRVIASLDCFHNLELQILTRY